MTKRGQAKRKKTAKHPKKVGFVTKIIRKLTMAKKRKTTIKAPKKKK